MSECGYSEREREKTICNQCLHDPGYSLDILAVHLVEIS